MSCPYALYEAVIQYLYYYKTHCLHSADWSDGGRRGDGGRQREQGDGEKRASTGTTAGNGSLRTTIKRNSPKKEWNHKKNRRNIWRVLEKCLYLPWKSKNCGHLKSHLHISKQHFLFVESNIATKFKLFLSPYIDTGEGHSINLPAPNWGYIVSKTYRRLIPAWRRDRRCMRIPLWSWLHE